MIWQSFILFEMNCQVKLFAVLLVVCILLGNSIPADGGLLDLFRTYSPPNAAELQSALDKFNAAEKLELESAKVNFIERIKTDAEVASEFWITARLITQDKLNNRNAEYYTNIVRPLYPARNYTVTEILKWTEFDDHQSVIHFVNV